LNKQKERTRFLRFAAVGAMGAVIDFGVLNLLIVLLHVKPVPASMVSFTAAVISNFLWNRYWTYPDSRSKHISHQLGQFFLVSIIGLAIRTPLFALFEKWLTTVFSTTIQLPVVKPNFAAHNIALALVIGIIMIWNFLANRFWTYSDVE
jgi:putative flippase GtrA